MKRTNRVLSVMLALVLLLAPLGAVAAAPSGGRTVYRNATFFTSDPDNPSAEAVVVEGGRFAFVGGEAEALAFAGADADAVDLGGQFVTPGFFDAHIHMAGEALMGSFDFRDHIVAETPTVDQYIDALTAYLAAHPDLECLRGTGWDNTSFPGTSPTKELLDQVNDQIPIGLRSLDGHSLWANSKAIEQAGVTAETQVPGGEGTIVLNERGEVSGTFREPAAIDLVLNAFPPMTAEDYKASILKTQKKIQSLGVTGVLDALVYTDSAWYQAYRELAASGELKLHMAIAFSVTPLNYEKEIEWVVGELAKYPDGLDGKINIATCKFFADGVLEGGTAYLEDDYSSHPGDHGIAMWDKEKMADAFRLCDEAGIRIHVHSIGDAATSMTLDCMEGLSTDHRNALCHLQLVDEKDYQRFADMGISAIVPPLWAFRSEGYEGAEEAYLGAERVDRTYPIKTFLDMGITTAAHSDYPVSAECAPLIGIEIATTRLRPASAVTAASTDEPPLNPSEAITAAQAIDIHTRQGAYANALESVTGTIEVGKSADFAVIDNDILTTPASLATVTATYFEGEKVFSK